MEFLQEWLQEFTYLGIFGLLVIGGFGQSASEEAVLVLAGMLLYAAEVNPVGVLAASYLGVIAADSISYAIGRGFGARILSTRWARMAFHPRRLRRVRKWFELYGGWTIFIARFMVGLRAAAIFSAGAQHFSYWRFLTADAAAAALHVPLLVGAGYFFSRALWSLERGIHAVTLLTLLAALALTLFLLVRHRRRRERRR